MKQGQETNQIWTHEAGTHDTHNRTLTVLLAITTNIKSESEAMCGQVW